IEDAESAPHNGLRCGLVCQAHARGKVFVVRANQSPSHTAASRVGRTDKLEVTRTCVENEIRLLVVLFDEWSRQLVAQPEREREPAARFPVILHKAAEHVLHKRGELLL